MFFKTVQPLKCADKRLLRHILGVVGVTQMEESQAKNCLLVLPDQLCPCRSVPPSGTHNQLRVAHVSLSGKMISLHIHRRGPNGSNLP
jgi:hypothetical protein